MACNLTCGFCKNAILKAHLDDCLRVLCRQKASIVDGVSSKFRGRLLINTSLTKIRIGKDIKLLVIILIPFIMIIQNIESTEKRHTSM